MPNKMTLTEAKYMENRSAYANLSVEEAYHKFFIECPDSANVNLLTSRV